MSDQPPFNPPRMTKLRRRPATAAPGEAPASQNFGRPIPVSAEIAAEGIDEKFQNIEQMSDDEIRALGCLDLESYVAEASADRRVVAVAEGAKGKEIPFMEGTDDFKYEKIRSVFPGMQYVYVYGDGEPLGRIDVEGVSFHEFVERLRQSDTHYTGTPRKFRCLFYCNGHQKGVFMVNLGNDPKRKAEYDAKVRAIQQGTYAPPGQPQPAAAAAPAALSAPAFPGTVPQNDAAITAYREMADRERRRAEEAAAMAAAAQREAVERVAALERQLAALAASHRDPAPPAPQAPPAHLAGPPPAAGPPPNVKLPAGYRWTWEGGEWTWIDTRPPPAPAAPAQAAPAHAPAPPPQPAGMPNLRLKPGERLVCDQNGLWEVIQVQPATPATPPPPAQPQPTPPPAQQGPTGTGWGVLGELASGVQTARREIERVAPALGLNFAPPASAAPPQAAPAAAPAAPEKEPEEKEVKPRVAKMSGLDIPVDENGEIKDLNLTTGLMNLPNIVDQVKAGFQFMNEEKKKEAEDALAMREREAKIEAQKKADEIKARREQIELAERELALMERKAMVAARQQEIIRQIAVREQQGHQPAPHQLSGLPEEAAPPPAHAAPAEPPPAPFTTATPPPPRAPVAPEPEAGYDF